ncbi:MAG: hypothetical protein ACP5XB_07785 [Isosphaeraceae bacterium]
MISPEDAMTSLSLGRDLPREAPGKIASSAHPAQFWRPRRGGVR